MRHYIPCPVLGLGLAQGDITGLKEVENDILKLSEKLLPLSSAYNQSNDDKKEEQEETKNTNVSGENLTTDPLAGQPGAPSKKGEQKAATTIAKEKSEEKVK